jgi:hypothetical protein
MSLYRNSPLERGASSSLFKSLEEAGCVAREFVLRLDKMLILVTFGTGILFSSKAELIQEYRYFVYKRGNIKRLSLSDVEDGKEFSDASSAIDDETYRSELMCNFKLSGIELMTGRIRYFSDGIAIGSKKFLKEVYAEFCGDIIRKKDRNIYQTGIT